MRVEMGMKAAAWLCRVKKRAGAGVEAMTEGDERFWVLLSCLADAGWQRLAEFGTHALA